MKGSAVISWSGGKDSVMTLEACKNQSITVVSLLTTLDEHGRVKSHGVPRNLIEAQAASLGKHVSFFVVPEGASNEAYEDAMRDALQEIKDEAETLVFGDIFLEDIRAYREVLAGRLGFNAHFPLWGQSTEDLAHRAIAGGYRSLVVCCDTDRLPSKYCGYPYTLSFLRDLPAGVDPCGENGEFHTFVFDGPLFSHPVPVKRGEVYEDGKTAKLRIRLI